MKPAKASSFLWLHEYHEPHLCTKGPLLWCPFPVGLACSAASLLAPSAGSQAHAGFSRFVLWVPPPGLQMLVLPCPGSVPDTLQKRGDTSGVTGPGTGLVGSPSSGNQSRPGAALPPSTQWSFLFLRLLKIPQTGIRPPCNRHESLDH